MKTEFYGLEGCIPREWNLVPVDGNKRPVDIHTGEGFRDWQKSTLKLADLLSEPQYVQAIGVLTGPSSNGLLVLDIDSNDGRILLETITGKSLFDFPATIGCTSGRQGSQKLFYHVPQKEVWQRLRTVRRPGLDILWNGCQAVLMGEHPTTGGYHWLKGCAPYETALAVAPYWLVDSLM